MFASGLDDAWEHEGFAVADEVADGGGVGEDFEGEDASFAIGSWDELLGDDAAEGFADHDSDLVALIGGEDVEDAIEGSGGVSGVEGAEDEVTGFGGGDGELNGFEVAHFTDHDDVGVFAKRASESGGEASGVGMDFALGDVALVGFDDVLDGVFEGDDVIFSGDVHLVDECGEGGGFS